jgi:predicted DNA-binding WGR domain protein
MKRYFINQEGQSNKFWSVETDDATYTVTFGKIGVQGRQNSKSLADAASCEAEIAKLIADKVKKGYLEVREGEEVPQKATAEYRPMDEDLFWEIIASFNWKKQGNDDAVMLPAEKLLASLPVEDIFTFDNILAGKLYQLDGKKYADACYPKKQTLSDGTPYMSVDDFLYCRCCVVVNGRKFYEFTLEYPKNWPLETEFESILYLAQKAYERKTHGQDYPHVTELCFETYSNRAGWAEA